MSATTKTLAESTVRGALVRLLVERGVPLVRASHVCVMRSSGPEHDALWAAKVVTDHGERYATTELNTDPAQIAESLASKLVEIPNDL